MIADATGALHKTTLAFDDDGAETGRYHFVTNLVGSVVGVEEISNEVEGLYIDVGHRVVSLKVS